MATHISKFATNFNNKLACPRFIHIDLAPKSGIPESILEKAEYEIRTEDNSHSPVKVKLDDLCRMSIDKISGLVTWQSHGMTRIEFIDFLINSGKEITGETQLAIYFFKAINNEGP